MKKIKKGFSFIELIIVITIIGIITVFGINSFSDQIDRMKINNILSEISGDIKDLDNKVNTKQIFDYEIEFIKGKKYYLVNKNIYDLGVTLKLDSLNDNSGSGNIVFSGASSGSGEIKYYEGYKFIKKEILNYNKTFTGSFNNKQIYKIFGSYSGSILNNLEIRYFDKNKFLKLVKIDTNNSIDLNKIKIKNILGKKQFGNLDSINKIVLTFEDELGKTEILEITK